MVVFPTSCIIIWSLMLYAHLESHIQRPGLSNFRARPPYTLLTGGPALQPPSVARPVENFGKFRFPFP